MKNSIKYLLLSAAALAAVSCENWLDVTPPSEIRAEDHYSSAEGFQQTLIGCYLAMGEADLYGENLTWHMIEMLGRQYDARKNAAADDYDLDRYNYKTTKSTAVIEKVWEKSYSVITNANDALDYIDRRKDELDTINYRIIKGELLAVRAYVHFDDAPVRVQRPGRTHRPGEPSHDPLPDERRQGRGAAADLRRDAPPHDRRPHGGRAPAGDRPRPARYPESIYTEANVDKFYDYRQMHLNYFAVKALLARVCMWEGSDENRHTALQACPRSDRRPGIGRNRRRADAAHVHRRGQGPHDRDVFPERAYLRARRHGHGQENRRQPQPRIQFERPPVLHAVHQELDCRRSFRNQGRRHLRLPATNSSTTTPTTGPRGPRPLRSSISRPRRAPITSTRT